MKFFPKQKVKKVIQYSTYAMASFLLLNTPVTVLAKTTTDPESENSKLHLAFDLVVRQLAEKNALITDLRSKLAESESNNRGISVQLIGCPVAEAQDKIESESFIYEREETLIAWLKDNLNKCRMPDLEKLVHIANKEMLNQARKEITKEIRQRGDKCL
jgi:hypothetical protein